MTPARILVVEDSRVVARDIAQQLTHVGHTVVGLTGSGEEAVALATSLRPDLVLMDIRLEGPMDGIDAAEQIRLNLQIPVVYLTAYADDITIQRARTTDPFGYLLKPFEDSQLRTVIEMALYKHASDRRLRESERRYAVTLASIGDAVIATDSNSAITFMNPVAEQLTGWSQVEAKGRPLLEVFCIVNEATGLPVEDPAAKVLRTGAIVGLANHTVLIARDGRRVPIDDSGAPIVDDRQAIVGVVLVFRDVTARRRSEQVEALALVNERLNRVLGGSNVGVWEFDMPNGSLRDATLFEFNCWACLGYPEGGEHTMEERAALWHPEDRPRVADAIDTLLSSRESIFTVEARVRRADGKYSWRLSRGVVQRDEHGKPLRFAGTTVDISDRKQAELELRHASARAEAANLAKDEFLANVSHEIRTPMNAIVGMTELVLDSELSQGHRQALESVRSAAGSLLLIINDLLDFSKLQAGKLLPDQEAFSLTEMVGESLRALSAQAHHKGLELLCDIERDVPELVIGDAPRLRQVLLNLLGNAIKFTAHGEVLLSVERLVGSAHDDLRVRLRFTVRDTGIGVPEHKQASIFLAFEQEDSSTTRRYGGTGLGLTIADRLVGLMGGKIELESQPGKGSAFSFALSFAVPPVVNKSLRVRKGLRVLIADANPSAVRLLSVWLGDWGATTTEVSNAARALEALEEAERSGRPYAFALVATKMPYREGPTLIVHLARSKRLPPRSVIALTAGESPSELDALAELELAGQLAKPVMPHALHDLIASSLQPEEARSRPATRASEPSPRPGSPSLRILAAEDNPLNAQVLQSFLTRWGHQVSVVGGGADALAAAEQGEFDLLLLDLHMPDLDGFEVIRRLRERERATSRWLPVVAVTARARPEDRERCLAAGMDDFLAKPITQDALRAALQKVIARARRAQVLSRDVLRAACGEDPALLESMCSGLRATLPSLLSQLGEALRAGDVPLANLLAHKLCGVVSAFSVEAGELASAVEDHATAQALGPATSTFEELVALSRELLEAVEGLTIEALAALPPS